MDKTENFIVRAKTVHGEKYDYSKVEYIRAVERVIIICKEHGEFPQTPDCHMSGRGCHKCAGTNKKTTEEFIIRAKTVHGEKYDYSKVEYVTAHVKIKIICKEHGEFTQTANSHIKGNGCRDCGLIKIANSRRSNVNDFILKARKIHGDKYNYSESIYKNTDTPLIITCPKHSNFLQTPYKHLLGQGCSKCSGNFLHSTDEFIAKAVEIHGNRYDYSKVDYINSKTEVTIICSIHGDFLQTPSRLLTYNGCQRCSKVYQRSTEEWIDKAKEVHGDKFDYSKAVFMGASSNICITCPIHGEFHHMAGSHLMGHGCIKCSKTYQYTTGEWIEKAKEVHGDKFDYSKTKYINKNINVTIICPTHGPFQQSPCGHLRGSGCIKCSGIYSLTADEWILKAKEIHGNRYDYSKSNYIKHKIKVEVICPTHGPFFQNAYNHLKGYEGCSKCWKIKQHSKKSIQYLNFISALKNITIQHAENDGEFVIPNTRYKADGYCLETNTVYEFHGDYWHGNPKLFPTEEFNKTTKCCFGELYQKTLEREQQVRDLGFHLVVMWEHDWKKINNAVRTLQGVFRLKH